MILFFNILILIVAAFIFINYIKTATGKGKNENNQ